MVNIFDPPQGIFTDQGFQAPPVDLSPISLFGGGEFQNAPFSSAGISNRNTQIQPRSPTSRTSQQFGTDPSTIDRGEGNMNEKTGNLEAAPGTKTNDLGTFMSSVATALSLTNPVTAPLAALSLVASMRDLPDNPRQLGFKADQVGKFFDRFDEDFDLGFAKEPDPEAIGAVADFGPDSGFDSGFGVEGDEADNEAAGLEGAGADDSGFDSGDPDGEGADPDGGSEAGGGGGGGGDGGGGGGGWIICSELYRQGRMTRKEWLLGARYMDHLSDRIIRGYHWWGTPYVKMLRKSPMLSAVSARIGKARAGEIDLINKGGGWTLKGRAAKGLVEGVSWCVGGFVGETDWEGILHERG